MAHWIVTESLEQNGYQVIYEDAGEVWNCGSTVNAALGDVVDWIVNGQHESRARFGDTLVLPDGTSGVWVERGDQPILDVPPGRAPVAPYDA